MYKLKIENMIIYTYFFIKKLLKYIVMFDFFNIIVAGLFSFFIYLITLIVLKFSVTQNITLHVAIAIIVYILFFFHSLMADTNIEDVRIAYNSNNKVIKNKKKIEEMKRKKKIDLLFSNILSNLKQFNDNEIFSIYLKYHEQTSYIYHNNHSIEIQIKEINNLVLKLNNVLIQSKKELNKKDYNELLELSIGNIKNTLLDNIEKNNKKYNSVVKNTNNIDKYKKDIERIFKEKGSV